jgi:hypothetical protein
MPGTVSGGSVWGGLSNLSAFSYQRLAVSLSVLAPNRFAALAES